MTNDSPAIRMVPPLCASLMSAGALLLGGCTAASISRSTDYHGWKAVRLGNEEAHVIMVPEIARVMTFQRTNGPDLFWSNSALSGAKADMASRNWQNFGGSKVWLAPQSAWGWPPDPVMDHGSGTSTLTRDGTLHFEGMASEATGVRLNRNIKLSDQDAVLTIDYSMQNTSTNDVSWSIWQVAQMQAGGRIIVPASGTTRAWADPQFKASKNWTRKQDIYVLHHTDADKSKMMFIGPEGWIAYEKDGEVFVMAFEPDPDAVYPKGHGNAEVYVQENYIEIEHVAPLTALAPGETTLSHEKWTLFSIGNCQLSDLELAERVRTAVKKLNL